LRTSLLQQLADNMAGGRQEAVGELLILTLKLAGKLCCEQLHAANLRRADCHEVKYSAAVNGTPEMNYRLQ
jgi:hypothetical protein